MIRLLRLAPDALDRLAVYCPSWTLSAQVREPFVKAVGRRPGVEALEQSGLFAQFGRNMRSLRYKNTNAISFYLKFRTRSSQGDALENVANVKMLRVPMLPILNFRFSIYDLRFSIFDFSICFKHPFFSMENFERQERKIENRKLAYGYSNLPVII